MKAGTWPEEASTLRELYKMISRRAYELFAARGYEHGHDQEDWFQAEAELLRPVRPKIHHALKTMTMRAQLPGFRADEIEVFVEPQQVTLVGRVKSSESKPTAGGTLTVRRVEHVFRVVELPAKIEPSKATAALRDDVLEVILPKVEHTLPRYDLILENPHDTDVDEEVLEELLRLAAESQEEPRKF